VATFGANGILGVGPFVQDCGDNCVNGTSYHFYFSCPSGGGACSDTQVTLAQQVANPVASFTTDNNGVIVELPSIPDAGALTATGALVFGIGTQSNNALGSATVLTTDGAGDVTVNFNSSTYTTSYIDSGSNLNYFDDNTLTTCNLGGESYFCPSSEQSLSATIVGQSNVSSNVTFNVANAQTQLSNTTNSAFDNIAAPGSDATTFDFGLPFFYGHNVFTAIAGANTSGGMGPYFAY